MSIHPDTRIGAVRLTVADLERTADFYAAVIGLAILDRSREVTLLGAGGTPVVELVERPDAPSRARATTGLFHLAILVSSRRELARALHRVAAARWPLAGASDHLVSEALYLEDPEGNGIEIYRDRPRDEWPRSDGTVRMATLPLDLRALLAEPAGEVDERSTVGPETRVGHVHLNVSDLVAAERFYSGVLGFEVTVRDYPGALFVSAGGYHHHVGLNTWTGEGAAAPAPGSRGLRWFELVLPGAAELDGVAGRLRDAGHEPRHDGGGLLTTDPSSNGVLIRVAEP